METVKTASIYLILKTITPEEFCCLPYSLTELDIPCNKNLDDLSKARLPPNLITLNIDSIYVKRIDLSYLNHLQELRIRTAATTDRARNRSKPPSLTADPTMDALRTKRSTCPRLTGEPDYEARLPATDPTGSVNLFTVP